MERFNPNEYKDLGVGNKKNGSTINNFFVPVLIVACSCLAMLGVTFSTKLIENDTDYYKITVDIINGKTERYEKTVAEGSFSDVIMSNGSFGSISCTKGELNFDSLTNTISNVYVNRNISCVLVFKDDGVKALNVSDLTPISDNTGTSYYYKADATNNYIKLDDKMFRIIRINGDGTLRVMLNEVILYGIYGSEEFSRSNLKTVLDDWFESTYSGRSYTVEKDFDYSNYEESYDLNNLYDLDTYYVGYVGTLSVREAAIMSEGIKGNNFLETAHGFHLMNPSGFDSSYYYKDGMVQYGSYNNSYSIRPVINIKVDELSGLGTFENPYTFE